MNMLKLSRPVLCLALLVVGARAEPLKNQEVAADAKWVLHLDLDALLNTKVGKELGERLLGPKLEAGQAQLKEKLGVDYDWHDLHGFTLYGRDYRAPREGRGVLLIHSGLDLKAGLEAAMKKQGSSGPVAALQEGADALYSLDHKAYAALAPKQPAIIGQSQDQVEEARAVILGKRAGLSGEGRDELQVPKDRNGAFIFVAAARGFANEAPLPPQAQVLRKADGLQATLRESGDNLLLNLALLTKDSEVSGQIQQVILGLKALVAMGANDRPEVQRLAQAIDVGTQGDRVEVTLKIPVQLAMQKLREQVRKQGL
ncbi:MAG: hypothetical protein H7A46_02645 [Verrucomicrobiales bacterium]|nr:hypothetical protein [Verrucomicrobiales bacterium]